MEVYRELDSIPARPGGRAVALGTFDGVHKGHRRVIAAARDWARARGIPAAVATFEPHPLQVLRPQESPPLLTTTPMKIDLVAELGVDELVLIPFTRELSRLGPEEFCSGVLAGKLDTRYLSVGANFRFGHRAAGGADTLESRPEFEAEAVSLVEQDGAVVSSTRIRELVGHGDVAAAAHLLESPFQVEGTVVRGDARGRGLGMPTANVEPGAGMVVPAAGVYAGTARGLPAAINVGVRPTFESDGRLLIEAHLVGLESDIYGETLRIAFLERLRAELRFDSAEELVAQMRKDVERAREIAAAWSDEVRSHHL
jgi:riboflavin kinase/FMN adenylyltransferase